MEIIGKQNRYERLRQENPLSRFVDAVYGVAGKPVTPEVKKEIVEVVKGTLTDRTSSQNQSVR